MLVCRALSPLRVAIADYPTAFGDFISFSAIFLENRTFPEEIGRSSLSFYSYVRRSVYDLGIFLRSRHHRGLVLRSLVSLTALQVALPLG